MKQNGDWLKGVDADPVDFHGVVLRVGIPGGQPLGVLLPKFTHLIGIGSGPRFVERNIDTSIGEKVASNGHIQDEVELNGCNWNFRENVVDSGDDDWTDPTIKRRHNCSWRPQILAIEST